MLMFVQVTNSVGSLSISKTTVKLVAEMVRAMMSKVLWFKKMVKKEVCASCNTRCNSNKISV